VRAIINLAKTLGLEVTAEGVETLEQMTQLNDLSCDWGQGFYFARPMPGDAISALIESGSAFPAT
jgi:EAL domain-containing protein (putative c-di-GMP-specific phosphodiesterase class I)